MITLHDDHPSTVERMLLYLYVLDYDTGSTTEVGFQATASEDYVEKERNVALQAHVAVYAVADKYDIPSLKAIAKSKFDMQIGNMWPVPRLPNIANEVFSSTPCNDRGLRDVILKLCVSHAAEIVNESFSNTSINSSSYSNVELSAQEEEELTWNDVLRKDGVLVTEIPTNVVKENDEELSNMREGYEIAMEEIKSQGKGDRR